MKITGTWLRDHPQPCKVCGTPQTYILNWPICAECQQVVYAHQNLELVGAFDSASGKVVRAVYVNNGTAYVQASVTHPAAEGQRIEISLAKARQWFPEAIFILVANPASGGWVYFFRGSEEDFCTAGLLRGHEAHPETLSTQWAKDAWLAGRGWI